MFLQLWLRYIGNWRLFNKKIVFKFKNIFIQIQLNIINLKTNLINLQQQIPNKYSAN